MEGNTSPELDVRGDLIIYQNDECTLLYDKKSRSVLDGLHLIRLDGKNNWERYIEAKKRELFFKRAVINDRLVSEIRDCLSMIYGQSTCTYYASTTSNALVVRYEKAPEDTLWVLLNEKIQ